MDPLRKNNMFERLKVEKRKVKRKLKKELRKWGPKNRPVAKAPRVSGAVKAAGKIESKEAKIARSYNKFLVDPCYAPPRLGSTGNYPTKMVHGYFKQTFLMSAPNWGTVPGLVNATSVLVALYPKMAPWNSTRLNLTGPFILAFADSDTVALNDATHGTIFAGNFSNSTALAGEVGSGVSARFMGGHCSLECRCPMMNVSPPYIYGGVLPRPPVTNTENNATDMTAYLFNQSGSTVRNYPQSDDVQGFSVSTVYSPGASEDLNFFGNITNGDSGSGSLLCVPTPYCGMTSCPTTASVTVTISWWAEIQQNVTIAAYGGWKTGPKVSTEDVFDHLRRFNQIKPRALNQGVKSSDGRVNVPFVYPQINKQPEMTLEQKILLMEEKIKRLQLQIDDEEEEKFITTSPPDDSPRYVSLSRSTLDLLKDKLTPGSVTSKTARIQTA